MARVRPGDVRLAGSLPRLLGRPARGLAVRYRHHFEALVLEYGRPAPGSTKALLMGMLAAAWAELEGISRRLTDAERGTEPESVQEAQRLAVQRATAWQNLTAAYDRLAAAGLKPKAKPARATSPAVEAALAAARRGGS